MRQIVAVLGNSYERPISAPLADMHESRDICERCHWALYDVGQVHKRYAYYSSEGLVEPWELDMLLEGRRRRPGEGIDSRHPLAHEPVEPGRVHLYPQVIAGNRAALDDAIATLQSFYGDQMFPTMKGLPIKSTFRIGLS